LEGCLPDHCGRVTSPLSPRLTIKHERMLVEAEP
jgi:hypothetical protein